MKATEAQRSVAKRFGIQQSCRRTDSGEAERKLPTSVLLSSLLEKVFSKRPGRALYTQGWRKHPPEIAIIVVWPLSESIGQRHLSQDQHHDIMANFTERFIDHRGITFAAKRATELALNHTEGRLCVVWLLIASSVIEGSRDVKEALSLAA